MISSEASASELAINSAITPPPSCHASADQTRPSDTPLVRPPAPANAPPRHVKRAPNDPIAGATPNYYSPPCRWSRVYARYLVHVFIIYLYTPQRKSAGRRALLCHTD